MGIEEPLENLSLLPGVVTSERDAGDGGHNAGTDLTPNKKKKYEGAPPPFPPSPPSFPPSLTLPG